MQTRRTVAKRIGRWVYDDRDFAYGAAGWLLDGSPVVLDFMPGHCDDPASARRGGVYMLYNLPGFAGGTVISVYLRPAMDWAEREYAEAILAALAGRSR
jgi:hypothetical protein